MKFIAVLSVVASGMALGQSETSLSARLGVNRTETTLGTRLGTASSILDRTSEILERLGLGGSLFGGRDNDNSNPSTGGTTTIVDDEAYEESLIEAMLNIANVEFTAVAPTRSSSLLDRLRDMLKWRTDDSLIEHILNGGAVLDIVDPEAKARREEEEYDWTGYVEISEFCPNGLCPTLAECKVAKYTSQSGSKCKCPVATELISDIRGIRHCTDWSDMYGFRYYDELCPKDKCDKDSYCIPSTLEPPSMCACKPGFALAYSNLLKKWKCDRA